MVCVRMIQRPFVGEASFRKDFPPPSYQFPLECFQVFSLRKKTMQGLLNMLFPMAHILSTRKEGEWIMGVVEREGGTYRKETASDNIWEMQQRTASHCVIISRRFGAMATPWVSACHGQASNALWQKLIPRTIPWALSFRNLRDFVPSTSLGKKGSLSNYRWSLQYFGKRMISDPFRR